MNRVLHNKTSLFLMELIISILFFAISGAVCVQLFVSAYTLSNKSVDINNAVLWTQNISEIFWSKKGNLHDIADFYAENSIVLVSYEDNPEIGTMVMLFDEYWEPVYYPSSDIAGEEACYELILCISQLPAAEIYNDTKTPADNISGNALLGEIMILKLENNTLIDSIPENTQDNILSDRFVDYYIGTREAIANEP